MNERLFTFLSKLLTSEKGVDITPIIDMATRSLPKDKRLEGKISLLASMKGYKIAPEELGIRRKDEYILKPIEVSEMNNTVICDAFDRNGRKRFSPLQEDIASYENYLLVEEVPEYVLK